MKNNTDKLFTSSQPFVLKWVVSCTLSLLYGIFFLFFYPAYETNDDSIMQGIASGIFGIQNSEASLFTHFLFGAFLKYLYMWFPIVNWYGIFLTFFHIGSVLLISICLCKYVKNYLQILFGLMLIFTFSFYLLLKLQFTSTAFIVCIAGVIFLLEFLNSVKRKTKLLIISFSLLFLGGIIRWDACIATILFSIIPIAFVFWKNRDKKFIWIYLLPFLLLFLLPFTQKQYYEKNLNSNYLEYQQTAHQLLDYNFELSSVNLNEVGWNENDLLLFQTYFRADSIFSFQHLDEIENQLIPKWDFISSAIVVFNLSKSFLFSSICIFLLIFYIVLSKDKLKYIFALYFIFIHIGFLFLAAHLKLPLRVYLPCLFLYSVVLYAQILRENLFINQRKVVSYFVASYIFFCCILQTHVHWNIQKENRSKQIEFQELKYRIENYNDAILVFVDCPLPYFQFPVFQKTAFDNNLAFIPLATFTGSPAYESILSFYQITNFTSDLWNKQIIFVSGDENFFKYYKIFLFEHNQIEIEFEVIEELPFARKIIWKN